MGKQIAFIIDDFDESRLVKFILKEGQIYFEGDLPKLIEIFELPRKFSGQGWFKV